jgi:UPF0755 protein
MTVRGGGGPREGGDRPAAARQKDSGSAHAYRRSGRYDRGPGDQRRFERYGNKGGGLAGLLRFAIFIAVLAAVVIVSMITVARPLVRAIIVPWANGNPSALSIGFVADLVREDLGAKLTDPASTDTTVITITVETGETPTTIAPRLLAAGVIADQRAFLFQARMDGLAGKMSTGDYALAKNLTPAQVVLGLQTNRIVASVMNITFREGLRLEQMATKLQTVSGDGVDPAEFLKLAQNPPDSLLADYPWLLDAKIRPEGASLEGFLYPDTYQVRTDLGNETGADGLIRKMLDNFYKRVGADRFAATSSLGLTFHQVLTLASIVEQEAAFDVDRPLIAGVYANRLNPKVFALGMLQSDPTLFYTNDTLQLAKMKFTDWTKYVFWDVFSDKLPDPLPASLVGYNTYATKGLPPTPICAPALASIDAAISPKTSTGYLYFYAYKKKDGTLATVYAKTLAQHNANIAKYGP